MGIPRRGWQLGERPIAQRWNTYVEAEDSVAKSGDDPGIREAIDGVDKMGLAAEGVGAAGADADLQCEFDRADRDWPPGSSEMPGHRTGEEHSGWSEERCVDDLEVGVGEREGGFSTGAQGPEPQALHGLALVAGWVATVTGDLRVHRAPFRSGLADAVG